jgi:hypothetical protein
MSLFINCTPGCLEVSVFGVDHLMKADSAKELAEVFASLGVTETTEIYCSSSVDFCEEYGWKPGAASAMIQRAFKILLG